MKTTTLTALRDRISAILAADAAVQATDVAYTVTPRADLECVCVENTCPEDFDDQEAFDQAMGRALQAAGLEMGKSGLSGSGEAWSYWTDRAAVRLDALAQALEDHEEPVVCLSAASDAAEALPGLAGHAASVALAGAAKAAAQVGFGGRADLDAIDRRALQHAVACARRALAECPAGEIRARCEAALTAAL